MTNGMKNIECQDVIEAIISLSSEPKTLDRDGKEIVRPQEQGVKKHYYAQWQREGHRGKTMNLSSLYS